VKAAYFHLIQQVLGGVWAITPSRAEAYLPLVEKLLSEPQPLAEIEARTLPTKIVQTRARSNGRVMNIGVMSLDGVVTKHDQFCGPAGTISMIDQLAQYNANSDIEGILLEIDSGGGMVDGTPTFADAIAKSAKPVLSLVSSGTMASAGYWIGAGGKEVWASGQTDFIGSIGVMLSFADYRERFQKEGIKIHEVYSNKSSEKNAAFMQAREGNYDAIRAEILDPLANEFEGWVKSRRKNVNPSALKGKLYNAADAKAVGLIDQIGSKEEALKRLANLVEQGKKTVVAFYSPTNNTNTEMRFAALARVLGFNVAATSEGVNLDLASADLLEKKTAELEALAAEKKATDTELSNERKEKEALKAELQQVKNELTDAKAKLAIAEKQEAAADASVTATAVKVEQDAMTRALSAVSEFKEKQRKGLY
jgi:ClpP class serine protease